MSDEEDYSSGSDEDYVPSDGEAVSEEENSGDEEDLEALHAEAGDTGETKGKKRKKTNKAEISARKRKGGIKLDGEENKDEEEKDEYNKVLEEEIKKEEEQKHEEKEKKRADDLWSSFLSDVGTRPKPKPAQTSVPPSSSPAVNKSLLTSSTPSGSAASKVTITKEFDFAGEVVRITKDVDVTSKEGQKELKRINQKEEEATVSKEKSTPAVSIASTTVASPGISPQVGKKPGGGLGSVLSKINRKDKMSTLDKSKLDWEAFKQKEGIGEELKIHNRGKEGYIERMQFLNRTDQRQFEIERDLRLGTSSSKR